MGGWTLWLGRLCRKVCKVKVESRFGDDVGERGGAEEGPARAWREMEG